MNNSRTAKKLIKWLLALLLVTVFTGLLLDVLNGTAVTRDDYVFFNIVCPLRSELLTGFFGAMTLTGSAACLLIIAVAALLFIKDRKIGICIFSNLFLSAVLNMLIKLAVQRPRPPEERRLAVETTFSFPSGHAMISAAFYGLLIYFILRFIKNKPLKISLTVILCLLILIIGASRVYLSVHYLSDVIAGFAIAGAYLICFISVIGGIFDKKT